MKSAPKPGAVASDPGRLPLFEGAAGRGRLDVSLCGEAPGRLAPDLPPSPQEALPMVRFEIALTSDLLERFDAVFIGFLEAQAPGDICDVHQIAFQVADGERRTLMFETEAQRRAFIAAWDRAKISKTAAARVVRGPPLLRHTSAFGAAVSHAAV